MITLVIHDSIKIIFEKYIKMKVIFDQKIESNLSTKTSLISLSNCSWTIYFAQMFFVLLFSFLF